jgi:hypothetical protein
LYGQRSTRKYSIVFSLLEPHTWKQSPIAAGHSKPVCLGKVLFLAKGKKVEVPLARLGDASGKGPLTALIPLPPACELNAPEASASVEASNTTDTPVSTTDIVATIAETIKLHGASIAKSMRHLNSRPSEPSTYTLESGLTITIHCGRNGMPKKTLKGAVPG